MKVKRSEGKWSDSEEVSGSNLKEKYRKPFIPYESFIYPLFLMEKLGGEKEKK